MPFPPETAAVRARRRVVVFIFMQRFLGFLIAVATCHGLLAGALRTVIDDFDSYSGESYIQHQNPRWLRFGVATTDGLYSIANGASGRAAEYAVDWAAGKTGYIRHNFENYLPFFLTRYSGSDRGGIEIALDIAAAPVNPATRVYLVLSDGDPEKAGTTLYRTKAGRELAYEGFATMVFVIDAESVVRLEGTASLGEVLPNLSSLTFQFVNESGVGSQVIRVDNFAIGAAPERR